MANMKITCGAVMLLLLSQCFICYANKKVALLRAEQSKQGHTAVDTDTLDQKHLPGTGRVQKAANTLMSAVNDQVNGETKEFPCPVAEDIAPCVCTIDAESKLLLDCTNVASEEQLAGVFQKTFPVKEFYEFTMTENSAIKNLGNILNGVTFEIVLLFPGPFSLESVSDYFLHDSVETLELIHIHNTNLTSEKFPFFTTSSYTNLDHFEVDINNVDWIPQILGDKLIHIDFAISKLTKLEPGTFTIKSPLRYLAVYSNLLHTIAPGAFVLDTNNPPDSFELLLYDNELTTIEEDVFGEIIHYISTLYISGNPLECGCDIAWLVLNESFMAKVDPEATCSDNTNLHDLDPLVYESLCG